MPRPEVVIRMAKNDDGDRIAELMKKNGFFQWDNWEIDWHDIEPSWLAAEINGVIEGVIQITPAKPIGRIEVLSINQDLPLLGKTRVARALTNHGMATLKMYGSQVVSSSIPWRYGDYLAQAAEENWISLDSAEIVARRLV